MRRSSGPAATRLVTVLVVASLLVGLASPQPAAADEYDVLVVGDGIGGVGAAVTAARMGADVALFTFTLYPGGQASAGGVSTLDEGSPLLRRSGLYAELVRRVVAEQGAGAVGGCYFSLTTLCPQPDLIAHTGLGMLEEAGVEVIGPYRRVDEVLQDGSTVTGVVVDGVAHEATVVIDASERSDLYPLVDGLEWVVGGPRGCVQDMTWPVVLSWYPEEVPDHLDVPESARDTLAEVWGDDTVDTWLEGFREHVVEDPDRPTPESGLPDLPWSWEEETRYRAVADIRSLPDERPPQTRTVINLANDAPLPVDVFLQGGDGAWEEVFRQALHRSYLYMWYLRHELEVEEWAVSDDLGYDRAFHLDFDEAIPNLIEAHFPPLPYLREGRRLAGPELNWTDLSDPNRQTERFADSVMLGAYFTDFHGCPVSRREMSGYGLYEVPLAAFIPQDVDGFLPGLARSARVDRAAASSLRMQPPELLGGQVVGTLAALSVSRGERPRDVPAGVVRSALRAQGAIVDMPDPRSIPPRREECVPYPWSCPDVGQRPE